MFLLRQFFLGIPKDFQEAATLEGASGSVGGDRPLEPRAAEPLVRDAGEVRDPQRTLPRAIVGGTLAILSIYLAANVAYLYVASPAGVAQSPLIAADVASRLLTMP